MNQHSEIFRALGDPTRRAVFERLFRGEATVSEIKSGFSVSQPAISQHLAALKKAGLVTERRDGRNKHYSVDATGLKPLIDWVRQYEEFWHRHLRQMKSVLEEIEK